MSDDLQSMPSEMECRDFHEDNGGDDMSDVTLSTFESSRSRHEKKPSSGGSSKKWGLLWKTKSPLQTTAKKLKRRLKKKKYRERRESPEDGTTIVEENSTKSWGVHWPSTSKQNSAFFEGVVPDEEAPDDEVPGRQPIEHVEDASRVLAEMNEKFRKQEQVDECRLCRLELQEMKRKGRVLDAQEDYELQLLERHAMCEDLYEEANDLDDFVEKRILYKRLEIDLQNIRGKQSRGMAVDEDLLFVLELFERRRLQQHLHTMQKLALDLLERDRLGDALDDDEMDQLIDVMDTLKSKKVSTAPNSNAKTIVSSSSLMIEDSGEEIEKISTTPSQQDPSKDWGWTDEVPADDARNEVEKGNTTSTTSGGWLMYWRSDQQQQAQRTRQRIQKELLDKALLKAKLMMDIDNLKMDLKKANASVLELGGSKDETTRIILNEGGLPPDESILEQQPGVSDQCLQKVRTDCEELKESNQEMQGKIATLEAQVRELRAKAVTSTRENARLKKEVEGSSAQDAETLTILSVECEQLKEELRNAKENLAESQGFRVTASARLETIQTELDKCSQDLENARFELEIQQKESQNAAFEYSALNVRFNAASSKIERLEEEYPETTKERVAELLEEAGKSGGIKDLVSCYETSITNIESLQEKLEAAEEECAAANQRQQECDESVAMCQRLEKDAEDLRSKLQAAELESNNAKEETAQASEEIEVLQSKLHAVELQMDELQSKLQDTESEVVIAREEKQRALAEMKGLQSKLEATNGEKEVVGEEIQGLKTQLDAIESECAISDDEKIRASEEIESLQSKLRGAEAKSEQVSKEVSVLASKLGAFEEEATKAIEEKQRASQEAESLRSKLKAAESEVTNAKEELKRASEEIASLQSELESAESEVEKAIQEKENASTETEELKSMLEAVGSERTRVLEEMKGLQSKLEIAELRATRAIEEKKEASEEIARLQTKLQTVQLEATKASEEKKRASEEIGDLQHNVDASESEKKRALEEVANARSQMQERDQKIGALSRQVEFLEDDNCKLLKENVELKELCEEMISGIGGDGAV